MQINMRTDIFIIDAILTRYSVNIISFFENLKGKKNKLLECVSSRID